MPGPGVAGRAAAPAVRAARVRDLTRWNDRPGRTRDEVLALIDLASSRAIMEAMQPVGAHRFDTVLDSEDPVPLYLDHQRGRVERLLVDQDALDLSGAEPCGEIQGVPEQAVLAPGIVAEHAAARHRLLRGPASRRNRRAVQSPLDGSRAF